MRLNSLFAAFTAIAVLCTCTPSAAENDKKPGNGEQTNPDPEEKPGQTLPETIKILAIGNSFSADAVEQELYGLFEAAGQKVIIGNLYVRWRSMQRMRLQTQLHTVTARFPAAP